MQKLYTRPDCPKPATQPSHPNQLSLKAQYIAALGKLRFKKHPCFIFLFPVLFPFHFLIFLEAQLQGRTYSLQLLLRQKSICPTVTVTICRVMTTENVECAWVPGCSAQSCSCPELQRIWTTLPEEEQNMKAGVMLFLQAWPGTWHRDPLSMNYHLLKCGKHTDTWNLLMRYRGLWSKLGCKKAPQTDSFANWVWIEMGILTFQTASPLIQKSMCRKISNKLWSKK